MGLFVDLGDRCGDFLRIGFAEVTLVSGSIAGGGALPNMLYSSEARTAIGEAYDAIFAGGDVKQYMDEANEIMQELLDQEAEEAAG